MILYRKLAFILCFLQGVILSLHGQDLLNYSNSLKYANYLYENKYYSLSAIEYERVSYLEPKDTLAKLRMIRSYSLMDDYKNAKARLERLFPLNISNYPEDFAIEYYSVLFHQNQFNYAISFIKENKTINQAKRAEYELGALLMQYKWAEAKTVGDDFLKSNQESYKFCNLYNIAYQSMDIKYKKPGCAALLSALVPGSGKVYTKNWKDGVYAFIFISTFSWLTYKSIDNDALVFNSVFYGAITLSFYLANIYGSYKSAQKYNQKVNKNATGSVQRILFDDK
jgi:hypothetical protein